MATGPTKQVQSLVLRKLLNFVLPSYLYNSKNNGATFWVAAKTELIRDILSEQCQHITMLAIIGGLNQRTLFNN